MTDLKYTLDGIRKDASQALKPGKARAVSNYCDRINLWMRRAENEMQPAQKYNATQAIYNALCNGRHLSQLNCREFQIEDMRTPVSHMRDRIDAAGLKLCKRRFPSPVTGASLCEYWCEKKEQNN